MPVLTLSSNANLNYVASIVKLTTLRPHSNADKLQLATIFGNTVVVGLNNKIGDIGVYFPVECQIDGMFLSEMNLFSESTFNKDTSKKGYFPNNRRVRAVRLRGEKSEGIWIPLADLPFKFDTSSFVIEDQDFDTVDGQLLVTKYVVQQNNQASTPKEPKVKGKVSPKMTDYLVDNQFKLHFETPHLGRNLHRLNPESKIVITQKVHGSSCILSKVLVKRPLKWYEKWAKRIGVAVIENEYGYIWSSGKPKSGLPKGIENMYKNQNQDFYNSDIWRKAFNDYKHAIESGITLYGELIGYTESGGYIQKGYDYECEPGEYKFQIYRITSTNADGKVIEFTWDQVHAYCKKYVLETTETLFEGKVKDYFDGDPSEHWNEELLKRLEADYLERRLPNGLPDEGICVRIENGLSIDVLKFKSFLFTEHETKSLDKGEVSIEDVA